MYITKKRKVSYGKMRSMSTIRQRKCYPNLATNKSVKRKSEPEYDTLDQFINLNEFKGPLMCCSLTFNTNVDFALHSNVHAIDGRYACHLCDYKKKSKVNIIKHVMRHDAFKCKICKKVFKRKSSAIKHSNMHTTMKPAQCEICGKQLSNPKNLQLHREMVHLVGKPLMYYDCTICNKKYKCSSSLRRHCSYNHKELGIDVSVICEICGKSISTKGGFQIHLKTHTIKKPFPCNVCTKTFATKSFFERPYGKAHW
ncbi:hypothetical protein NQ314_009262 [Rhamnusium bicolor]|uniref:C2H2-type domain-containing protein n=1 Tax=Rhamnusium bicolor TaxID=1586634 RepID=A0AAV8Y396_9CUCU|nr:hypothetical protein NQ314_009262 [Rhamnusium bicolor]